MFTSAHVSNLALRNLFFLWCAFNLYSRLVIRWCGVGNLVSACVSCLCTCRQKDSSLDVNSSDWLHMELSRVKTWLTCSWCALGDLVSKDLLLSKDFSSCSTSYWHHHIYGNSCTGTFLQYTWTLLHVWNLHTCDIYFFCCGLDLDQIFSWVVVAVDCHHLSTSCTPLI